MKLVNCPDCDRPVGANLNCPWCGAAIVPQRKTLITVLSMSAMVLLFTISSCIWIIPPPQNNIASILLGFIFGGIVALLFKYKYPLVGLLPMGGVYLAFLDVAIARAICIHTPYILFLFSFALFFNSLKKKILPLGGALSRLYGPSLLWIPFLVLFCCYASSMGALLIPALLALFVILQIVFAERSSIISFAAVLLFTGFAILYFNIYAYAVGFIAIAIAKGLLCKSKHLSKN